MRTTALTMFLLLLLAASSFAVTPSPYQTGQLVDFQVAEGGQGRPTCTMLAIAVHDLLVHANQCASFPWHIFDPGEFTVGGEVQVRFERNFLMIQRPNSKELKARVMRRMLRTPTHRTLLSVADNSVVDGEQGRQ